MMTPHIHRALYAEREYNARQTINSSRSSIGLGPFSQKEAHVKAKFLRHSIVTISVAGVLVCVAGSEVPQAYAQKQGGADNSSSKSSSTSSSSSKSSDSGRSSSSSKSSDSSRSSGSSGRSSGDRSSGSGRENRSTSGGSSRSSSSGNRSASTGSSNRTSDRNSSRHENKNRDRDNGSGRDANDTVRSENRIRDRSGEGSSLSSSTTRNNADRNRGDRKGDERKGHHEPGRGFNRGRDGNFADWHRHECERGRHHYPTRVYEAANYDNYSYGLSAYEQGYEDGLRTGASDAWRGESYEPERSHFYKHGAGGFLSVFGNRASYASAYRDGFLRGYEEGYQNYSSYFIGGRFRR